MSKTKKTASKTTKAAKAKPATQSDAQPAGECPKGGKHEWVTEESETTCKNCLEPRELPKGKKAKTTKANQAGKRGKAKKQTGSKKLSAIEAAAKLLADAKEPMNCKEMIEAMAAKKLWTSPAGATPHATLYSAITREIAVKGKEVRFVKTERGKFAAK